MDVRHIATLALGLVLTACIPFQTGGTGTSAPDSLTDLNRKLNDLRPQNAQDPAVQAQYATLATNAQEAAKTEANPQSKVALYRIAAIAAWQAGPAPGPNPLKIQEDGQTACAGLQLNQARPTDCAVISLAASAAVADDLQGQLSTLKAKHRDATSAHRTQCQTLAANERQTCMNTRAKLPQSDGATIENDIFRGFRDQFETVTQLRSRMSGSNAIDDSLHSYTNSERVILYCSALTSLSLLQDCQGSEASVQRLKTDLTKMQCQLTRSQQECEAPELDALVPVECNIQPPNAAPVLTASDS